MLILSSYTFAFTVEDANREYWEIVTRLQAYLDVNNKPLFYISTENMFAVLMRKVEVEGYTGYIYLVFDSAMMKAEDFPFKMKGPARYPIIVFKKN